MDFKDEINYEKYKNSLLYFIKYCNNQYLGATKLNKLAYYFDFINYRDNKVSATGDTYIHMDYGPVGSEVNEVLSILQKENRIETERVPYEDNGTFHFKALSEPDLDSFTKYEKDLLEKICKEFRLWSTDKIVDQTHLEAPWFYSKPYEEVDYNYAHDIEFFTE
jgi:uncharacterized phage-associated protein